MAHQPIWSTGVTNQAGPESSLPVEIQLYIKNAFWPHSRSSIAEYASYFKYLQWSISILSWPDNVVDKEQFAAQTYADLAKIVRSMKAMSDYSRISIALELQREFPKCSIAQILRSMDLATRLWLMIYVRSEDFPIGPSLSYFTGTSWDGKASLTALVEGIFSPDPLPLKSHDSRIDPSFTVSNLRKFCRIKVQWTANLRDHLSCDGTTLYLFPHKICLISHLESCDILPNELVAETIKTLDLLFPFAEESTHKYLDDTGQSFHRTSFRDLSRATKFEEFQYWRKRLMELHEVYNQAPNSVLQMWHDRRNPMQWWTFWLAAVIAVMTVFFGVLASYTGFVQVSIAQKSYDLALSQACPQSEPPKFCTT